MRAPIQPAAGWLKLGETNKRGSLPTGRAIVNSAAGAVIASLMQKQDANRAGQSDRT
jgi:hypothetical protein